MDDLVGHVVDKGEQDGAEPRTLLRETNGNAGCDNTQAGKLDGVADTGDRAHEGNLDGLNGVVIKLLAGIEGGLALVLHRNDDGVDERGEHRGGVKEVLVALKCVIAVDIGNERLELPDGGSALLLGVRRAEHQPPDTGEESTDDTLLLLLGQPVSGLRGDGGVSH